MADDDNVSHTMKNLLSRSMAYQAITEVQCADLTVGPFFKVMYEFSRRMHKNMNLRRVSHAILSLSTQSKGMRGWYQPIDSEMFLSERINLNIDVLRNGAEAAECLLHEMVHQELWHKAQRRGTEMPWDYHGPEFVNRIEQFGIECNFSGYHVDYVGPRWEQIMKSNADLELSQFMLPGMAE